MAIVLSRPEWMAQLSTIRDSWVEQAQWLGTFTGSDDFKKLPLGAQKQLLTLAGSIVEDCQILNAVIDLV